MKLDALDHPKTMDFAARLQVSRPTAIGHLELLWAFTGKQSAQGNVGKWPDGAIARACDWMDSPQAFITALIDSRFLDPDPSYRLTVHDWSDHAPGWVRAKLKKVGLEFISSERSSDATSDPSSEGSSEAAKYTSEPSSRAPVPSVVKGSEGKRSEESRDARASRLPDDWPLTDARRAIAKAEQLDPDRTYAKFTDYWRSASGANARKRDWDATWRNWCRSEADRNKSRGNGTSPHAPRLTRFEQMQQQLKAATDGD